LKEQEDERNAIEEDSCSSDEDNNVLDAIRIDKPEDKQKRKRANSSENTPRNKSQGLRVAKTQEVQEDLTYWMHQ